MQKEPKDAVASNPTQPATPPLAPSISSEEVIKKLKELKDSNETAKATVKQFATDNKGCPMELRIALNYLDTLKTAFKPFDTDWPLDDSYHIDQKNEYKRLIAKQDKLIETLQRKYAQLI